MAIYFPLSNAFLVLEGDCFVPRNDVHAGFSITKLIVSIFSNNAFPVYVFARKHALQEIKFELKKTKHVFVAIYFPLNKAFLVLKRDCFVPRNDVHAGVSVMRFMDFTVSNNESTQAVVGVPANNILSLIKEMAK